MDCFLLEGVEVIFRLALALLTIGKPNLLVYDMEGVIRVSTKQPLSAKLEGSCGKSIVLQKTSTVGPEEYLFLKSYLPSAIWNIMTLCVLYFQYFQKDMPARFESDPEEVMNLAFSLKINHKKMKKMEKEYTTMKTKEKEDEIELRVSF